MRTDYKAVFFDWDGTAVPSRYADASRVLSAMEKVLRKGIKLIIVSGTTYENICGGKLEQLLPKEALQNLYLGLARGNFDYGYDEEGRLKLCTDATPNEEETLRLHDAIYAIHRHLLKENHYRTDVVFSRPNYCKVDLMVENTRGADQAFIQADEVEKVNAILREHQVEGGLPGLLELACEIGRENGLTLSATTDAKFLEVGYTTKSDNVNRILSLLGFEAKDCCFWGDEFGAIAPGIWGSDAQMVTEKTRSGDFYSVSPLTLPLPEAVHQLGGGEDTFIGFLESLAD